MSGALYIVPTPIGNLGDITLRCIEVLKSVDRIACEDTRHTLRLLNHLNIQKKLVSYFEHNKREKGQWLVQQMEQGESVALVTDAGTPGISDPGEDLVELCIEKDIEIISLPGACAFVTALVASGLPTGRFVFEGFLSVHKKSRFERLESLKDETATLIFYEAPHKLEKTLKDLYQSFGDRRVVLARELTKRFEEFSRTTLKQAVLCMDSGESKKPKGEYVVLVEGMDTKSIHEIPTLSDERLFEEIKRRIDQGEKLKNAVKEIAQANHLNSREVYQKWVQRDT